MPLSILVCGEEVVTDITLAALTKGRLIHVPSADVVFEWVQKKGTKTGVVNYALRVPIPVFKLLFEASKSIPELKTALKEALTPLESNMEIHVAHSIDNQGSQSIPTFWVTFPTSYQTDEVLGEKLQQFFSRWGFSTEVVQVV